MYDRNDVENEQLYINGETEIVSPFDPRLVDIEAKQMVLSNIVDRLRYNEIDLSPDFQRNRNLWDKKRQSRLIESLLIRIPLPTFYFDMADDEKLIVVDGVQRLSAIHNFMATEAMNENHLRLEGLEYLKELEGKSYEELAPNLQRRLREQNIQTYVIKAGTPDKVRNSIFERINTGGLVLTPAEIKNSVFRGTAANLLKNLAENDVFKKVTRNKISSERMLDREFANRFLAFYILDLNEYHENIDDYLKDALIKVKNDPEFDCKGTIDVFLRSLNTAHDLFGNCAFRKITRNGKYGKINKPLFEAVTVQLARLSEEETQRLLAQKEVFLIKYDDLLKNPDFVYSITNGTASMANVECRHKEIERIIRESILKC